MSEGHIRNDARPMVCLLALALACGAAGCGDDSSSGSSPSGPSAAPTTSSVSVAVKSPIRMGESAQATGTATSTTGQSQNVTTGWRSENTGVASVTDAGMVSGVANGQTNIFVETGGRRGQQAVRVVPDYQGTWAGTIRITACTQTGVFVDLAFCSEIGPVNSTDLFDLSVAQTGEALSVTFFFGESRTVATSVAADGSAAFAGNFSITEDGVTVTAESAWRLNSTQVGALTGTVTDTFRVAGFNGEGRVIYEIQSAGRSARSALTQGARDRRALMRGLSRRLRVR